MKKFILNLEKIHKAFESILNPFKIPYKLKDVSNFKEYY